MKDLNQTKLLIRKAKQDLKVLPALLSDEYDEEIFGFHAQQAVEKLLKAWINYLDKKYPLIHNIGDLYDIILPLVPEISKFEELIFLTPYSVIWRYEEIGFEQKLDRQKTLDMVNALLADLEKYLEKTA
jgi:HEPN domain-containing protein